MSCRKSYEQKSCVETENKVSTTVFSECGIKKERNRCESYSVAEIKDGMRKIVINVNYIGNVVRGFSQKEERDDNYS